jgi:hypothetical protein
MPSDVIDREYDAFHWHPYVTIEKYSPDQTAFAEEKLATARTWRRLPLLNRVPVGGGRTTMRRHQGAGLVHDLHGDWLRELFPGGPEDGYAYDDGNLLVNNGLTTIINILHAGSSTAYNYLTNGNCVVGVGSTSTAATTSDTHLGADGTTPNGTVGAYYQGSDATYPNVTGPATINNQCTYASGSANMAWAEWCWATGAGTITAGSTLGTGGSSGSNVFATATSTNMINHKISSLGTKASGASWVFSTTIVFS